MIRIRQVQKLFVIFSLVASQGVFPVDQGKIDKISAYQVDFGRINKEKEKIALATKRNTGYQIGLGVASVASIMYMIWSWKFKQAASDTNQSVKDQFKEANGRMDAFAERLNTIENQWQGEEWFRPLCPPKNVTWARWLIVDPLVSLPGMVARYGMTAIAGAPVLFASSKIKEVFDYPETVMEFASKNTIFSEEKLFGDERCMLSLWEDSVSALDSELSAEERELIIGHLLENQKLLVLQAERVFAWMDYHCEQVKDVSSVVLLESLKNRLIRVINALADAMYQCAHQKENNACELLKKFPPRFKGLVRQFDIVLEEINNQ